MPFGCTLVIVLFIPLFGSLEAYPVFIQTSTNATDLAPSENYTINNAQLFLPGVLLSNSVPPNYHTNYSHINASCSHCFMGLIRTIDSSVFSILANPTFNNYSNSNENCSQCFQGLYNDSYQDDNRRKSVGCVCGLFTTRNPDSADIPLRTKSFHNVTCHVVVPDEDACQKVCIFDALAYNELEPENICSHLNFASNITAYVQSKICEDNTVWVFTGLASPSPACCNQGTAVSIASDGD